MTNKRFGVDISEEELWNKIWKAGCIEEADVSEVPDISLIESNDNVFAQDSYEIECYSENITWMGYTKTYLGVPYFGVITFGDWESPVFSAVYWDGSNLRRMFPMRGNRINPITKSAFGNNSAFLTDGTTIESLDEDDLETFINGDEYQCQLKFGTTAYESLGEDFNFEELLLDVNENLILK